MSTLFYNFIFTYSGEVNQKNAEERGTMGPALSCVVKLNLTIVKL